jgi:methyl-accepting chemotaxis protein
MELSRLEAEAKSTGEAYQEQADALEEAKLALEEYRATIDEMPGSVEQAADATEQFWIDNAENITVVVAAAQDAVKALDDYAKGVHDSVASAINSTVGGFGYIGNAAQRQEKRLAPLTKELEELKKKGKDLGDINVRISDATDTFGVGNLKKNLDSQLQFLREYKADMEKARAAGFSDSFLAQFSDGSVESAEWLHELANASDTEREELNALYADVEKSKSELTDTLTAQNLSVDETYKTLAAQAKEAVAALDMQGEAAENTGKTIDAIVSEIGNHVPDVAAQVDAILAQLNRLNGWGINIDFAGFGSIDFTTNTGKKADASGRFGLDYVPRDDYIIRAHEGERLLNAQENQIWNTLLNGGVAGFDLDALGGVMRDNIKTGGNVYLDGRAVGSIISDRQGRNYRSLQRSGWQS